MNDLSLSNFSNVREVMVGMCTDGDNDNVIALIHTDGDNDNVTVVMCTDGDNDSVIVVNVY